MPKPDITYNPEQVKQTAAARIAADSVFRKLKNDSQVIGKQSEREYSLQINKYKQDQKQMRDVMKDVEQLIKMETPMQIAFLKQDESKYYSEDKDKTERYKQWLTNISKDIYVDEAVKVINDMSGKTHSSGRTIPVASNKQ